MSVNSEQLLQQWAETQRTLGQQSQSIDHLAKAQQETNAVLRTFIDRIGDRIDAQQTAHKDEILSITNKINSSTKTDVYKLGTIILSTAGFIMTLVVLYGRGTEIRLSKIDSTAEKLSDAFDKHKSDGHPHTVIDRTERNNEEISRLRNGAKENFNELTKRLNNIESSRFSNSDWEKERTRMAEWMLKIQADIATLKTEHEKEKKP